MIRTERQLAKHFDASDEQNVLTFLYKLEVVVGNQFLGSMEEFFIAQFHFFKRIYILSIQKSVDF